MSFTPSDMPPHFERVERDFPFPLALTSARVRAAFARRQPLEAVWAVRDAWEAAIKFCACVSVADFLQADPDRATAEAVAAGLLSNRGVAIGGWKDALVLTLPAATAGGRLVPELRGVFRKGAGSGTTPHFQAADQFTAWRNEVFGHGVFTHDLPWYAGQAAAWVNKLVALYDALRPVLAGWALVGRTADGQTVDWSGCEFEPKRERHRHDPLGHALPMFLAREGAELSFGPLLSVQRCHGCDHPAAFFFDRQKKADETVLLEYVAGAKGRAKGWAEVDALRRWLPAAFTWERQVYDTGEVVDGVPIAFRDFAREYLRPGYLLDAIRERVGASEKGYVLVDGPEGTGKSYLARGLAEQEADAGLPVLAYYVRPGDPADYQFFASELNARVKETLGRRTLDLQLKATTAAELQAEFADYFARLLAGRAGAILVIDALDELPDGHPATPLITDLLPDPADLPPNLHVVLTARAAELKPRAAARWHALAAGSLRLTLDPASAGNRGLVGEYLARERVAAADDILARSGGVFLYAWHYVAALRQGAFAAAADLPPADQFYPAFLDRIRRRVGDPLFETVYLQVLTLLTAARVPVTRERLERWGIPADRLATALNDLRDFVRQIRHREWHEGMGDDDEPRYKIAHEAFVRFVEAHQAERLTDAHRTIVAAALRHTETKWEGLNPADDGDLYDVRFVLHHCDAAGMTAEAAGLRSGRVWPAALTRCGDRLAGRERYPLARELFRAAEPHLVAAVASDPTSPEGETLAGLRLNLGHAQFVLREYAVGRRTLEEGIALYRRLGAADRRPDLTADLARTHVNLANVLCGLGEYAAAVAECDEAVSLFGRVAGAEVADELAMAFSNKANALAEQWRFADADACFAEAERALDGCATPAPLPTRVMLLSNRVVVLLELGRLSEATEFARRAVELADDIRPPTPEVAQAYGNLAATLTLQGRFAEAEGYNDRGIATLTRLGVPDERPELSGALAKACIGRGELLRETGRYEEADELFRRGLALYRRMAADGGVADIGPDMVECHNQLAICNRHLGRWERVEGECEEALALLDRLDPTGGRPEFAFNRARVLSNHGLALMNTDRWAEALDVYDRARGLVGPAVSPDDLNRFQTWSTVLHNRGLALASLGRFDEAVANADDAIAALDGYLADVQTPTLIRNLADAYLGKAHILEKAGRPDDALDAYDRTVGVYNHLIEGGHHHLLDAAFTAHLFVLQFAVDQARWSVAASVLVNTFRLGGLKADVTPLTESDRAAGGRIGRLCRRLSAEQREELLAVCEPDLADYFRAELFTTPPAA